MTALAATNRRRRVNAVRQLLGSNECKSLLRTSLEMLGRHLALSGFTLAEPQAADDLTEYVGGVQAQAFAALTDPTHPQPLELRAVLFAEIDEFGHMRCDLVGHAGPQPADPTEDQPALLLCRELFESKALQYVDSWSTEEFRKALHAQLLATVNATFEMGVGPHAHRFRVAMEEALAP